MKLLPRLRREPVATAVVAVLVVAAVVFVRRSLVKPDIETFAPTPPVAVEAGDSRVGPRTVTVDASDGEVWRFFDFSRGSVVENPGPTDWDLAFRRFQVLVNGGGAFAGRAGVIALGEVPFDSVRIVPSAGYVTAGAAADSVNEAIERWYDYSWTSHLLTPKDEVYAIRTADGRYAKLEFVGYYCEGALAGCMSFRYLYQGAGGTDLGPGPDMDHGQRGADDGSAS